MQDKSQMPILIVEDSPEDYEVTLRGLRKAGLSNPIYHCEDGDLALDYLYHKGEYADLKTSPEPGLILLDLNLPGTDGFEILDQIKNDNNLKTIPVVILTTSHDERDIEKCYQAGANSYIQKPVDLNGFMQAIQQLKDFWFHIAVLPKSYD